jgi:hypothetical protein
MACGCGGPSCKEARARKVPRLREDGATWARAMCGVRTKAGRQDGRAEEGSMIVFGTVSAYPEKLATQCAAGIARSMNGEPYIHHVVKSNGVEIFSAYQQLMNNAARLFGHGDLKYGNALVLVHDDLEFKDTDLAAKIRALRDNPLVAITGLIGSSGARSLAWWEGKRRGRVSDDAYGLHDFGDFHLDVDSLDGMCLILSPWACNTLRLTDVGYEGFHGYADELCYQARAQAMRTTVVDITAHHHSKGGYAGGVETWTAANQNFRKRWLT